MNASTSFLRLVLSRVLPLVALAAGAAAFAQTPADPPERVGSLSQVEGSVVFAPAGETEWADAPLNRPVTRGDRLWTDRGAHAEVHMGGSVLHMDGQTFLDFTALDQDAMQAALNEGTVEARVRDLQRGENVEIDTPQLAFRASQPGDYRIDVDTQQGTTQVTVFSGAGLVYGSSGQGQPVRAGQAVAFSGRDLEPATVQPVSTNDAFNQWAAERNRAEDQSVTARYVPREVVGYQQLDTYGNWSQDPGYGAVWYPRGMEADWAPYRYGHWDFIAPWGWTWVDDAPWGFAPFHYGRWAMIGSRWAWVPGRIGPRPVYAPALVAFVGGGGVNVSLNLGAGPGIGWFPLGPGEVWHPYWRASSHYADHVNRYIVRDPRHTGYVNQSRPNAFTSVRVEDFNRGRPVHSNWQRVGAADIGRAQVNTQPSLPQPHRFADTARPAHMQNVPQLAAPGFAGRAQQPAFQAPRMEQRVAGERPRPQGVAPQAQQRAFDEQRRPQAQQQMQQQREQARAQREQQVQQQRQQREEVQQQRQQERGQQMQWQRQQHEAQRQQQQAVQQQQRAQREAAQQPRQQEQPRGHEGRGRDQREKDDNRSDAGDRGHGRGHG